MSEAECAVLRAENEYLRARADMERISTECCKFISRDREDVPMNQLISSGVISLEQYYDLYVYEEECRTRSKKLEARYNAGRQRLRIASHRRRVAQFNANLANAKLSGEGASE